jgi:hypothetical protein
MSSNMGGIFISKRTFSESIGEDRGTYVPVFDHSDGIAHETIKRIPEKIRPLNHPSWSGGKSDEVTISYLRPSTARSLDLFHCDWEVTIPDHWSDWEVQESMKRFCEHFGHMGNLCVRMNRIEEGPGYARRYRLRVQGYLVEWRCDLCRHLRNCLRTLTEARSSKFIEVNSCLPTGSL